MIPINKMSIGKLLQSHKTCNYVAVSSCKGSQREEFVSMVTIYVYNQRYINLTRPWHYRVSLNKALPEFYECWCKNQVHIPVSPPLSTSLPGALPRSLCLCIFLTFSISLALFPLSLPWLNTFKGHTCIHIIYAQTQQTYKQQQKDNR